MTKRPKTTVIDENTEGALLLFFGKRVRNARERAKLTRAQLGEMTGLAASYIFEMETQGSNATLKTVSKVAKALDLGPRDLFPESERDAVTSSGVKELAAVLQHASKVLRERQSQEAELIAQMQSFLSLRTRLEHLDDGSSGPNSVKD